MDSKLIKLAHMDEIPEGKGKCLTLPDGTPIALFHRGGQFFALHNDCPHMGGPLCKGELENSTVTCPWHGWQFDISSGACVTGGGGDVKSYKIVVKNKQIYINLSAD